MKVGSRKAEVGSPDAQRLRASALGWMIEDALLRNPFPRPLELRGSYQAWALEKHAATKAQASQVRANAADLFLRCCEPAEVTP